MGYTVPGESESEVEGEGGTQQVQSLRALRPSETPSPSKSPSTKKPEGLP